MGKAGCKECLRWFIRQDGAFRHLVDTFSDTAISKNDQRLGREHLIGVRPGPTALSARNLEAEKANEPSFRLWIGRIWVCSSKPFSRRQPERISTFDRKFVLRFAQFGEVAHV
uniref:(northern house mosquito) hypothetical protein n=1 Tax=Culex pipiens TaxID=7175 RepID=A0A8D8K199_CULPI